MQIQNYSNNNNAIQLQPNVNGVMNFMTDDEVSQKEKNEFLGKVILAACEKEQINDKRNSIRDKEIENLKSQLKEVKKKNEVLDKRTKNFAGALKIGGIASATIIGGVTTALCPPVGVLILTTTGTIAMTMGMHHASGISLEKEHEKRVNQYMKKHHVTKTEAEKVVSKQESREYDEMLALDKKFPNNGDGNLDLGNGVVL